MKIALLICGQMRTFDHPKVLKYLNQFIKKFNCDVFLSTWNNRGISVWSEHALKEQADIPIEFSYEIDTSKITKSVFITLSPLYSMNRLHSLIETVGDDYDHWILTRTDIIGKGMSLKELSLNKNELYTSYVPGDEWLTTHIDNRFIL